MGDEVDRFAYLIGFCKPTASQEDKLASCPWAGESELGVESNLNMSSTPEMTQSEPNRIEIFTPQSAERNSPREEEPLFHTPPEEQFSCESSSQGTRNCDLGDGFKDCKSLGTLEAGESEEQEMWGGTIPIDETQKIADGVDLVGGESGAGAVNLGGVVTEKVPEGCSGEDNQAGQRGKKREAEVVNETFIQHNAGYKRDALKKGGHLSHVQANDADHLNQSAVSGKTSRTRKVKGNAYGEDGGKKRCVRNAEEVENLVSRGSGEVNGGTRKRDCGQKRELPLSMKGKDKDVECGRDSNVEPVRITVGLLKDFLNAFHVPVGDVNDFEQMDCLEIAKKRGLTFPRPRWWPPEE